MAAETGGWRRTASRSVYMCGTDKSSTLPTATARGVPALRKRDTPGYLIT